MADVNVFGKEVIAGADRKERASHALGNKESGPYHGHAKQYVNEKVELLTEPRRQVYTRCLFYNATGEELEFVSSDSKSGSVNGSCPHPIKNGQWGAVLHVGENSESTGFVIYDVRNSDTSKRTVVLGWHVTNKSENKLYCHVYPERMVDDKDTIYQKMKIIGNRQSNLRLDEMKIKATIEEEPRPIFEVVLTRDDTFETGGLSQPSSDTPLPPGFEPTPVHYSVQDMIGFVDTQLGVLRGRVQKIEDDLYPTGKTKDSVLYQLAELGRHMNEAEQGRVIAERRVDKLEKRLDDLEVRITAVVAALSTTFPAPPP